MLDLPSLQMGSDNLVKIKDLDFDQKRNICRDDITDRGVARSTRQLEVLAMDRTSQRWLDTVVEEHSNLLLRQKYQ